MSNKKQKVIFQKIIAMSIILLSFTAIYSVTINFDYDWSWEKIPNYFISQEVETQEVPTDGVFKKSGPIYYIQTDVGEKIIVDILDGYQLDVVPEMYVYQGDELALKKSPSTGIFIQGLWLTMKISLIAAIFALVMGLIAGLARISKNPILSWPSYIYIELIRGTPLLVQLFIIYFMFGTILGIDDRFICGVIALGLFGGAYAAEIIRAGIQSIDKGQMEAARSLGLSYSQSMISVIFPQMLRRSIAALAGIFISLIKDSSLVSVMALTDLTKVGREVASTSFMVFEVWIIVALLYFAMTYGTSYLTSLIEKRLAIGESR